MSTERDQQPEDSPSVAAGCYAAALRLIDTKDYSDDPMDDAHNVARALLAIRRDVKAWMSAAPFEVQEFMRTVHVTNFLHERRKEAFQMQGRYDGAMSAECKAHFAEEHKLLTDLIEVLSA